MNKLKRCTGCGKELPETLKYFYKNGTKLRARCKTCIDKYTLNYYNQNKNKQNELRRERRRLNKDKVNKQKRENYKKDKNKIDKSNKEYRRKNKNKITKYHKEYRKNNKDAIKIRLSNYRTSKLTTGTVTVTEWANKILEYNGRCAYCGVILEDNIYGVYNPNGIVQEHIIPISLDGLNVIENVVPACQDCNGKKGTKLNWKEPKIFGLKLAGKLA